MASILKLLLIVLLIQQKYSGEIFAQQTNAKCSLELLLKDCDKPRKKNITSTQDCITLKGCLVIEQLTSKTICPTTSCLTSASSSLLSTKTPDNFLTASPTASSTPSASEFGGILSCEGVIGVSTGILTAVLVGVTMGWMCTCMTMRHRNKSCKSTRQDETPPTLNIVYDHLDAQPPQALVKETTLPGPVHAYETVELPSQAGNYDVISRVNSDRPHPAVPPIESHDPEKAYSTLDTIEEEHTYHVLEANIIGTKGESVVQLALVDHEYAVLENKGQNSLHKEHGEQKGGRGQSSPEEDNDDQ